MADSTRFKITYRELKSLGVVTDPKAYAVGYSPESPTRPSFEQEFRHNLEIYRHRLFEFVTNILPENEASKIASIININIQNYLDSVNCKRLLDINFHPWLHVNSESFNIDDKKSIIETFSTEENPERYNIYCDSLYANPYNLNVFNIKDLQELVEILFKDTSLYNFSDKIRDIQGAFMVTVQIRRALAASPNPDLKEHINPFIKVQLEEKIIDITKEISLSKILISQSCRIISRINELFPNIFPKDNFQSYIERSNLLDAVSLNSEEVISVDDLLYEIETLLKSNGVKNYSEICNKLNDEAYEVGYLQVTISEYYDLNILNSVCKELENYSSSGIDSIIKETTIYLELIQRYISGIDFILQAIQENSDHTELVERFVIVKNMIEINLQEYLNYKKPRRKLAAYDLIRYEIFNHGKLGTSPAITNARALKQMFKLVD